MADWKESNVDRNEEVSRLIMMVCLISLFPFCMAAHCHLQQHNAVPVLIKNIQVLESDSNQHIPRSDADFIDVGDGAGECKPVMKDYLACLKKVRGTNDQECRMLAKAYLQCRMDQYVYLSDFLYNSRYQVHILFTLCSPLYHDVLDHDPGSLALSAITNG